VSLRSRIRIVDNFSISLTVRCGMENFKKFVSISHTVTSRFLRYLAKRLTPTRAVWWTSGSRLVRKSGFEFPDHFCLRLWPWQRFALSDYSLVNVVAFCCFLFRKHSEWRRRDYWRSRGVVGYTETPEVTETVTQSHNLPPGRVYHY